MYKVTRQRMRKQGGNASHRSAVVAYSYELFGRKFGKQFFQSNFFQNQLPITIKTFITWAFKGAFLLQV